eukprot:CAMPEP_0174712090 /NCGR_PEP_ID=MMETSP1094-20130205/13199_1 /TAXON_ID=156173 /ORGANISM="Chrysochromulina brevifilum, Strain UTEX LB 985" /LENGTH=70 /DNA_ID=CAMNT_0015911109 /DNA_START=269 /DNA_END=481 /DNA_ORIENTATION=-
MYLTAGASSRRRSCGLGGCAAYGEWTSRGGLMKSGLASRKERAEEEGRRPGTRLEGLRGSASAGESVHGT